MRYTIIAAETPEQLERKVNDAIGLGWKPHGTLVRSNDERKWLQAMVKTEAPPKLKGL